MMLRLLFIFALLSSLTCLQAQEPIKISGSFTSMEVKSIFLALESKYPIHFFFQASELPHSPISISLDKEALLEASKRILQASGSKLQAFQIKTNAIVIGPAESILGKDSTKLKYIVQQDSVWRKEEREGLYQLETITISSKEAKFLDEISGLVRMGRKEVEALPSFMGEPDLINSMLYLPGVSTPGDGAAGFSVRGGNTDENLILLGDKMLFNANHAFGYFGAINTQLIREIKLYKGAIPAYYGGRISSVLDVQMKQASTETLSFEGGIGPLSAKVSAEIPVKKGVSSLLIGGRSVYSDWLLSRVNIPEVQNSSLFFYDLHVNYLHKFGNRASLTAEWYSSSDDFRFSDEFGFAYSSKALSVNLKQILRQKLSSTLSLSYNSYESTQSDLVPNKSSAFSSGIRHYKLKEKLSYIHNDQIRADFGASLIHYDSQPGERIQLNPSSNIASFIRPGQQALEAAGFASLEFTLNTRFRMRAGLRFSHYNAFGPGQRFVYSDENNPQINEIIDSISFERNKSIAVYNTPEPRLSFNFLVSENQAIKGGYSRMAQYIFQLSNFDAAIPTDVWTLSNFFFRPQRAHNISLEFVQSKGTSWSGSLASYYRWMSDLKDYVDFADVLIPSQLETEIIHAKGRAYGLELNVKKTQGDFQFNLSYTLSRSERKTNGEREERSINSNDWYLSNFDKPHEVNLLLNYRFDQRKSLALTFNYNTGRPTTAPIGYFDIDGQSRIPIYSGRNQLRIPDYHRLDIAYTIGKPARKKSWKGSWTFGIYNVYGRRNAYAVFFTQARFARARANRLSVMGSAFPAISYNVKWIKL